MSVIGGDIGDGNSECADEGYKDELEVMLIAVENAIRKHYDDTGDWLTEDMPSVLAAFG